MIRVTFFGTEDGPLTGYEVSGHAGYADAGQDIVCSAVSALTLNTANSLEALTSDEVIGEGGEDGYLKVTVPDPSPEAQLLLASLRLGLTDIRNSYASAFIELRYKED